MYADTIEGFAKVAEKKLAALRQSPGGFFVSSMLAGAYVGMGIILIFVLGNQAPVEVRKLIMGATFGIALTLVIIAGAELFTGHTMFMSLRAFGGAGWPSITVAETGPCPVPNIWTTLPSLAGFDAELRELS